MVDQDDTTVLTSFPAPRTTTNPYIVMLLDSLQSTDGVVVTTFTWRVAITRKFDVFHAHWPENLVTGPKGPKKLGRQVLFFVFLVLLRVRGTATVRTMHNLKPHESLSPVEAWLLDCFDRTVVARISLNDVGVPGVGQKVTVIPHGHYKAWFANHPVPRATARTATFAGLIRPYKNVEALVAAFSQVSLPGARLRVAGRPITEELQAELQQQCGADDRVSCVFRHLTDEELVDEVGRSTLVVLPYSEMYNSGAAIMALSLDRPVLLPDNEVNRALAAEVGEGWVFLFGGAIEPGDIESTLSTLEAQVSSKQPDLGQRDWSHVGAKHREVYVNALAARRHAWSIANSQKGRA